LKNLLLTPITSQVPSRKAWKTALVYTD
jgi:hypothetical protein